jgi:hypothetical protein
MPIALIFAAAIRFYRRLRPEFRPPKDFWKVASTRDPTHPPTDIGKDGRAWNSAHVRTREDAF